jgi:hypothetical protein
MAFNIFNLFTLLRSISYYFVIFSFLFLHFFLHFLFMFNPPFFYSYIASFAHILLCFFLFPVVFYFAFPYLSSLVPSSLYRLFNTFTCTLFVVTLRRFIITKIENCYFVLTKEIQILVLNNRISALYCVRLTAMGGEFD